VIVALVAPPRPDFATTLVRLRSGDEAAWAELYRLMSPRVLGYLRGLGASDADDLTGEVFVQVVRDVARFEGDERAFRAWLFTIAHHRFLDARRRARRRPVEALGELPEDSRAHGDATEEALASLGQAAVIAMLGRLSHDQRAVLLLRIVGDLTVEQVSRAVGKRPGAVKAIQRRALAAVRREIEAGRNPVASDDALAG
jgi:RNA polymerase sigma-70 factor (ECF subfamily)